MAGGHHANTPLSMHSEMMAIHSALAQSGTLASTAVSSIKTSFKLPGNSKHHTRLRSERLKAYVEAVFPAALEEQERTIQQCGGKSQVQEWRLKPLHLNLVKLDRELLVLNDRDAVQADVEDSVDKHRKKNAEYGKKGHHKYQYQRCHATHDRSRRQHGQLQPQHV